MRNKFLNHIGGTSGTAKRRWILVTSILVLVAALCLSVFFIDPVKQLILPEKASNMALEESSPDMGGKIDPTTNTTGSVIDTPADTISPGAVTPANITPGTATSAAALSGRPESDVYKEMHEMANTKIVADQIWGEVEITGEKVSALISEISNSDYGDKAALLEMLYNWRDGNFSNAVEEHNYLWNQLDGTLGKAYALRQDNLD